MNTETQARIYLAEHRGHSETDFLRSYQSFNFGNYVAEGRAPFGALRLLNDDTLRAGASVTMAVEQPTDVLLIPVAGSLAYTCEPIIGSGTGGFLDPGHVQFLSLTAGMTYTVSNPYEIEYVSFLQIWLTNNVDTDSFSPVASRGSFDLSRKNVLLPLAESADPEAVGRVLIGQFDGRSDGSYPAKSSAPNGCSSGIYAFALKGAFEVQNRLLHEKDGLALWNVPDGLVEFEALSNDAILVLLDIEIQR